VTTLIFHITNLQILAFKGHTPVDDLLVPSTGMKRETYNMGPSSSTYSAVYSVQNP
jgi:hypothetical protein